MGLFSITADSSDNQVGKNIVIKSEADFIQEGKITKYELAESEKFIRVEFTNTKGQVASGSAWLPNEESTYKSQEDYKKAVTGFMNSMINVSRKVINETYTCEGNNALDVAKKIIRDISQKLPSKQIFCKMMLKKGSDGKIYTNIYSYSPFTFDINDRFVSEKQKDLLKEKLAYKPDTDKSVEFKTMPDSSGLPF